MRYAVYWAPGPETGIWQLGSRWLGRDAASGQAFAAPSADHHEVTADARRYGLHATLAAPMELADGVSEAMLRDRLRALAARFTPFATPPWVLADVSGFLALVPDPWIEGGRPKCLHALADACVLACETLRRPLSASERERRSAGLADARARALLDRFGYPWVMELYFAHITLTRRLAPAIGADYAARLRRHLAAAEPLWPVVRDIALFVEPRRGEPLLIAERFPLGQR